MGVNNSKIVIPAEKTEKKIHPYKFWPLRYKIEDISVNITKQQDSKDEGKNLLGKNNNGESTSMVVDNGDGSSKNSVESLKEIDHVNATGTILKDKNENELKIAAGGNNNSKCENKKKSSGGEDDADSPSFKIYVRQPDDKDHGDRKVDGSSQAVGEKSETQVPQKINPCMTNDVAGKLKDSGDSGGQESNLNKEAVDMSNKQNGRTGRRVLLNGVWSPRDRFASLKRCVLAMSMCRSLQNSTSFGRDQRNVDKK